MPLVPEIHLQSRLHLSFLEQNCVYNDKDTPLKPNNPLHSPIKCDQHNRLYTFPLPWAIFQNNETSGIFTLPKGQSSLIYTLHSNLSRLGEH